MGQKKTTRARNQPKLRSALEDFRAFQSFCSHDFRARIGVIQTSLQLVLSDSASEANLELVRQAHLESIEALKTFDQLLRPCLSHFFHIWIFAEKLELSFSLLQERYVFSQIESEQEWKERSRKTRPHGIFYFIRSLNDLKKFESWTQSSRAPRRILAPRSLKPKLKSVSLGIPIHFYSKASDLRGLCDRLARKIDKNAGSA